MKTEKVGQAFLPVRKGQAGMPDLHQANTSRRTLQYGQRTIPYCLHLSSRKRLRIVVAPTLEVRVHAPSKYSEAEINGAIRSKARWIARQLDAMQQFQPLPLPHKYLSGETFRYLGRQYRLRVENGGNTPAKLYGRFLHVRLPNKEDTATIRKRIDVWYRHHATDTFLRYMDKWHAVGARHGIPESRLVIRRMRTRWGSCTAAGRITLNVNLIQAPVHGIEYVIMHELCHLKHHNHSKSFYCLLSQCMPDWERRKRVLDTIAIPADYCRPVSASLSNQ